MQMHVHISGPSFLNCSLLFEYLALHSEKLISPLLESSNLLLLLSPICNIDVREMVQMPLNLSPFAPASILSSLLDRLENEAVMLDAPMYWSCISIFIANMECVRPVKVIGLPELQFGWLNGAKSLDFLREFFLLGVDFLFCAENSGEYCLKHV